MGYSPLCSRVGHDLATKQQFKILLSFFVFCFFFKILLSSITDRPKSHIYSSISSVLFVVIVFKTVSINTG